MKKTVFIIALFLLFMLQANVYALTAGQNYTVSIEKINSDGTKTATGVSTTATADADGKITFTLSGVPDNTACNFMVVKATNSATGTVEKESVVPCATSGTTMPLGISDVTDKQTTALEAAFSAAKTDDPILAVFGMAIVRTKGITDSELSALATIANSGISGSGGYVDYLTTRLTDAGITASSALATYRSNIVSQLADPTSGYSKLIKDSVDATTASDGAGKRGEAASVLLSILVKATNLPTETGIHAGWIMEAFDAMGNIAQPAIQAAKTAGSLSAETAQGVDSGIGGGIDKLRIQQAIQKYSNAMTALDATGADVTQFQTAATTMAEAMNTYFSTFEQTAFPNGGSADKATIQAAQATLQTAMQSAFSTFMTSMAVGNDRITTMIGKICTALGSPQVFDPTINGTANCTVALQHQQDTFGRFKFHTPNGSDSNWPVNMVILTDWASKIKTAGGDLNYTRDDADMSSLAATMQWMGDCTVHGPGIFNKATCEANAGVWKVGRRCYGGNPGDAAVLPEIGTCMGNPSPYSHLFEIQEDITIRQFIRQAAMQMAGDDMKGNGDAEKAFNDGLLSTIKGNLGGTTDGTTAITGDQKKAAVELMQPPQM